MPTTPDSPEAPQKRRGLPFPLGWVALAAVIILTIVGGTTAYLMSPDDAPVASSEDESEPALAAEEPQEDSADAALTTPFSDPAAFVDQDVNTSARVTEVVHPNSFRIVSGSEDDLLVVYIGTPVVEKGMTLDVFGVMRRFTKPDIEEQLAVELPDQLFDLSNDEYAVVAHTVTIVKKKASGRTEVAQAPSAPDAVGSDAPITSGSTATGEPTTSQPAWASENANDGEPNDGSGDGSSGGGKSGGSSNRADGKKERDGSGSNSGSGEETIAYTGDNTSGQHSDEAEFEATLTERDGDPIRDAKVVFELKDADSSHQFSGRTNREGVATVTEELTETPGRYRLIVSHKTRRSGETLDKTPFVIEKDDTTLDLTSEEASKGQGNGESNGKRTVTLTATLTEADEARGLAGRTVDFFADGRLLGSATSDEYGVATLETEFKGNQKPSYEARFSGDDYFFGSTDST